MRKKFVMANWKMNGSILSITNLLKELTICYPAAAKANCVIHPPAVYLSLVKDLLPHNIALGAQNVFYCDSGAYTGEISAPMLQDFACEYVLIGHSERRHIFHEDEKTIAKKFHHVLEHGMIPVFCIGETLAERKTGFTKEVLSKQLNVILSENPLAFSRAVVAYEPVWAIGTGHTAKASEVQEVHSFVRELIAGYNKDSAQQVSILYGGSVNESNAQDLFNMPDVDGGLIGGASLHANKFVEIIKCIN